MITKIAFMFPIEGTQDRQKSALPLVPMTIKLSHRQLESFPSPKFPSEGSIISTLSANALRLRVSSSSDGDDLPPFLKPAPLRLGEDRGESKTGKGFLRPPRNRMRIRNQSKIDCRKTSTRRAASLEGTDRRTPLNTGMMRLLAPDVSSSTGRIPLSGSIDSRNLPATSTTAKRRYLYL